MEISVILSTFQYSPSVESFFLYKEYRELKRQSRTDNPGTEATFSHFYISLFPVSMLLPVISVFYCPPKESLSNDGKEF
jgi:hypothetical protein